MRGAVTEVDWRAFYRAYDEHLASLFAESTTQFSARRKALSVVGERALGCGDAWPLDKIRIGNYAGTVHERVDLLFFAAKDRPKLACHSEDGCNWKKCDVYRKGKYQVSELTPHVGAQVEGTQKRVVRVLMTGMFFEHDKTFLLPLAMPSIQRLARVYEQHPKVDVLIVGHTDTTGKPGYNRKLSKERAKVMAAYLEDREPEWTKRYQQAAAGKPWGKREDQHMLATLPDKTNPFYAHEVDGISGPNTEEATTRFQEFSNTQRGTDLAVDGILGSKTRRELVLAYMEIDGTTLEGERFLETHGCGEFHPDLETEDEIKALENRRVEVFFFDRAETQPAGESAIDPAPVESCPEPDGCGEYAEWRKRTVRTIDLTQPLGSLRVTVQNELGGPVSQALVRVRGPGQDEQPTDEAGAAELPFLETGSYQVEVTKPGFASATKEATILADQQSELRFVLEPFSLGVFLRRDGLPAGLSFRLFSVDGGFDQTLTPAEARDEAPEPLKATHVALRFNPVLAELSYTLVQTFANGAQRTLFENIPETKLNQARDFSPPPPRELGFAPPDEEEEEELA